MSDVPKSMAGTAHYSHAFEFRGSAFEYFKIWIVNLALTVITLGIFSAWAKVRTIRYFRGNTYVANHSFDYHASPWRILLGRIIALGLLILYQLAGYVSVPVSFAVGALFAIMLPWLIVSSLRFNARNTSYRNVRFNFTGQIWNAAKALLLWPLASAVTLGILVPLARKKRDYYIINHHTYGGKLFATSYKTSQIYRIYVFVLLGLIVAVGLGLGLYGMRHSYARAPNGMDALSLVPTLFILAFFAIRTFIGTLVFNLSVGNMRLDDRHRFEANLSPITMSWITLSNLVAIGLSLGLLYPWTRVRIARYQAKHLTLVAATSLDEFSTEAMATQNAIGEEVASFFDIDIGL